MFIPIHDHNPLEQIRYQYMTVSIIAVTVVIFVVFQSGIVFDAQQASAISLGLIPAVLNDYVELPTEFAFLPEKATLFTYAFVHGDWMHLFGNMLFVWVFGDNVEDAVGHWKFLAFYLLSAAGGAVAHMLIAPASEVPLIGASGAVSGIVAAYLMLHPKVRIWVLVLGGIPLPISAMWVLGFWIAVQVINVLAADPGSEIAWWAHIGGLVTGAALIMVMRRPGVVLFDKTPG